MRTTSTLKLLFALLAAGLTVPQIALSASAADFSEGTCGENLTWTLAGDGTLTISGTGDMDDFDRDETPWELFEDTIRKVVTGDEVTRIGKNAFYDCDQLAEVILGRGTAEVGEFAFRECSALHSFTPGDATQTVDSAFFDTDSLTTIYLRSSVTELNDTFRDMATVTSFVVDDNDGTGYYDINGVLYHYAIQDNETVKTLVKHPEGNKRTGDFTVESGTTVLGEKAFSGQDRLEAVYLPETVQKLSSHAFYGCSSLNGIYFYGKPPVSLVKNTFQNASDNLILYYIEGTEGWTDPWKNYDTESFTSEPPTAGDVNGDAFLDEIDARILIRFIAGWRNRYSSYIEAFPNISDFLDFNQDGFFNAKDIMILNRYLNGWKEYAQYFE